MCSFLPFALRPSMHFDDEHHDAGLSIRIADPVDFLATIFKLALYACAEVSHSITDLNGVYFEDICCTIH